MPETLGDRLSKSRLNKKLTMQQVADHLGIARPTYSGYESNYREPDVDTLTQLATLFDVSLDWLMTGRQTSSNVIEPEEREFLAWVKDNLTGSFFYDFHKSADEQKEEMMETLRMVWELEKKRMEKREGKE